MKSEVKFGVMPYTDLKGCEFCTSFSRSLWDWFSHKSWPVHCALPFSETSWHYSKAKQTLQRPTMTKSPSCQHLCSLLFFNTQPLFPWLLSIRKTDQRNSPCRKWTFALLHQTQPPDSYQSSLSSTAKGKSMRLLGLYEFTQTGNIHFYIHVHNCIWAFGTVKWLSSTWREPTRKTCHRDI